MKIIKNTKILFLFLILLNCNLPIYDIEKGEEFFKNSGHMKTGTVNILFNEKEISFKAHFGLFSEKFLKHYQSSNNFPKRSKKLDDDYEDYVGTDLTICCFRHQNSFSFNVPVGEYYGFLYNENLGEFEAFGQGGGHPGGVSDFPFARQMDQQFAAVFGYVPNILENSNAPSNLENKKSCSAIAEKRGNFRKFGAPLYYLDDITIWSCLKIIIKENDSVTINITSQGKKVNWNATLKQWFPGIFYLAPFVSGSVVYREDFTIQMTNSNSVKANEANKN